MRKFVTSADFKGTNIEKSYQTDEIFKGGKKGTTHAKHKYLEIKDGKYIYDHAKMTSKDHFETAKKHMSDAAKHSMLGQKDYEGKLDSFGNDKITNLRPDYNENKNYNKADEHAKLSQEHEMLAWKKETEERKAIKAQGEKKSDEKLGMAVAGVSSFDKDVKEFIESFGKKHPGEMPHKALAKEFGMNESLTKHYVGKYLKSHEDKEDNSGKYGRTEKEKKKHEHQEKTGGVSFIKKSSVFDILIPVDFEDRIEKK